MQATSKDANPQQWKNEFQYASSRLLHKLCELLYTTTEDGVRTATHKLTKKTRNGDHPSDADVLKIIIEEVEKSCTSLFQSERIREARKMALLFTEQPDAHNVQPFTPLMHIFVKASSLDREYHKRTIFICVEIYNLYHDAIYDACEAKAALIIDESSNLYRAIRSLTKVITQACLEVEIDSLDLVKRACNLSNSPFGIRSSEESSVPSSSRRSTSENMDERSSPITEQSLPDLDSDSRSESTQSSIAWKKLNGHAEMTTSKDITPATYAEGSKSNTLGRTPKDPVVISDSEDEEAQKTVDDTAMHYRSEPEEVTENSMESRECINDVIKSMEKQVLEEDNHRGARKGKAKAKDCDDEDYDFLIELRKDTGDHSSDSDYAEPKAGKKRKKRYKKALARIRKKYQFDLGKPDLKALEIDYEQVIERALTIVKSKIDQYSPPIQTLLQIRSRESIVEQIKNGILTGAVGLLQSFANGEMVSFESFRIFPSLFPDNDLPVVMLTLTNWDSPTSSTNSNDIARFGNDQSANAAIISSTTCPKRSIFALKDKILEADVVPTLLGKCSDGTRLGQIALWQTPPYENDSVSATQSTDSNSKEEEEENSWRKLPFFLPSQDGLLSAEEIRDALITIVENVFIAAFWLFQSDTSINQISRTAFPRAKPVIGLNESLKKDPFSREAEEVYMKRRKKTRSQTRSMMMRNR
ncbi:uncharacterized protein FA14DRAFT_178169 [Meira miltonrushii]|uniref:Uncharacterized protein n=1 Tax=Meira miltonrushii TaxID=1280837 RepID=A0A316VFK1_9BASI|nr:uncharacterized protein FA14DRAFT_178169 [Meira miltonrushii]PWN34771.1 hypothetical protein FA14DRAFT_178169 [Meira miltonrushii]